MNCSASPAGTSNTFISTNGSAMAPPIPFPPTSRHPLRPVDSRTAGAPSRPRQPAHSGRRGGGDPRDQRSEELLVGRQLYQEPSRPGHIQDLTGTQFIELDQEVAQWAGKSAGTHLASLGGFITAPWSRVPSRISRWQPTS